MGDEPRHPSATYRLARRELLEGLLRSGQATWCPCCDGDGIVSPRTAARAGLALACIPPRERDTLPDLGQPDEEDP